MPNCVLWTGLPFKSPFLLVPRMRACTREYPWREERPNNLLSFVHSNFRWGTPIALYMLISAPARQRGLDRTMASTPHCGCGNRSSILRLDIWFCLFALANPRGQIPLRRTWTVTLRIRSTETTWKVQYVLRVLRYLVRTVYTSSNYRIRSTIRRQTRMNLYVHSIPRARKSRTSWGKKMLSSEPAFGNHTTSLRELESFPNEKTVQYDYTKRPGKNRSVT